MQWQGEEEKGERRSGMYDTDIVLGERYRDEQTGVEGIATTVTFFQYGCERVGLEYVHEQRGIVESVFDAPRLVHVESGQRAESTRTGGDGHSAATRERTVQR